MRSRFASWLAIICLCAVPSTAAVIRVGSAVGQPGQAVSISVTLDTQGAQIAGVESELVFDHARVVPKASGRPDCSVNPDIEKSGTAFIYLPSGCSGTACTRVKAIVVALDNVDPIPNGAVLYTCRVQISPQAPAGGTYAFGCERPTAGDPNGNPVTTTCSAGSDIPTPSPTVRPGMPLIRFQPVTARRGEIAPLAAILESESFDIAGAQQTLNFTASVRVAAKANGRPDCAVNPDIDKSGTGFTFLPTACAGNACTAVTAIVLALDNVDPIPDGSTLYTCQVRVAADAPAGVQSLGCNGVTLADPNGSSVSGSCSAAQITVLTETVTATHSSTRTFTPTPTLTSTFTPTATPTPRPCAGDCNRDQFVTIEELVRGVTIALGNVSLSICTAFDVVTNGNVTIDELVTSVDTALNGCPDAPVRTPTRRATPPRTPPTPLAPAFVSVDLFADRRGDNNDGSYTTIVSAIVTDALGNPVADGTAVTFALLSPGAGISITSFGQTNSSPDCDTSAYVADTGRAVIPQPGTALSCLRYQRNRAGDAVTVIAQVLSPGGLLQAQQGVSLPSDGGPIGGPSRTPTILSGTRTPTTTPHTAEACGDGVRQPQESCEDGNDYGGDGCAANCTNEHDALCAFGGSTGALVQTGVFALPLAYSGAMTLTAGRGRDEIVQTYRGRIFEPGDIPVVIKEEDLNFHPIMVPGLVCACVRGRTDFEMYGPGNVGSGVIGCGEDGLDGVDVISTIDHNTNDVDPGCNDGRPDSLNPSVCNGRLRTEMRGRGPRGSVLLTTSTSITTISDGGSCAMQCLVLAGVQVNGPDCIPCTDDDPNQVEGVAVKSTTGTARASLLDLNNQAGKSIDCNQQCGGSACVCSAHGTPIADCDLFESNPDAGIVGLKLVGAYGAINAPQTGDIVVTTFFECVAP